MLFVTRESTGFEHIGSTVPSGDGAGHGALLPIA